MPLLIALTLYPMQEICERLAELKDRKKYSRQRVALLIKEYVPTAQKIGKKYYLTEEEIKWLALQIGRKKSPKKH